MLAAVILLSKLSPLEYGMKSCCQLLKTVHEFSDQQIDPEFRTRAIGELAPDFHSFEIDFLDQRVLCVFSLQRWAGDHGLLSFYLLNRIDEGAKILPDRMSFAGYQGRTELLHFSKENDQDIIGIGPPPGARETVANVLLKALLTVPAIKL